MSPSDASAPAAAAGGSWWSSLPGVLTAAGALVTAIVGLLTVLNQAGFIDRTTAPPEKSAGVVNARDAALVEDPAATDQPAAYPGHGGGLLAGQWTWQGQACAAGPMVTREGSHLVFTTPTSRFVHRVVADGPSLVRTQVLSPPEHEGERYRFELTGDTLRVFEGESKKPDLWARCRASGANGH